MFHSTTIQLAQWYKNPQGIKLSKMPKMIDIESTYLRRADRLDNKPKQKYYLFVKLFLSVIGACEVAKKSHIFLTGTNQHK